ncbi:hypothetical protein FTO70_15750 [Methanosarcina sp. KYL-1]|uniref:hypothetical protein n=1 Tax=Methanosarcina sp. KYL-1 TaxID=2602068 RepID=UPI002101C156|nr:hypothetical protein [Methanosarcina sp. KYL-1]MCQ1537100.1 hypothetical protein [Methanosarcina sp. KYL-1]
MIRKNVSMEDAYLQKLRPFLDENNGNLSAAIRDAIALADAALKGHDSIEDAMEQLSGGQNYPAIRNSLIESGECVLMSQLAAKWLIEKTDGILVEDEIVSELFNSYHIKTVPELVEYLNTRSRNLGWGLEVSTMHSEADKTEVIVLEGGDPSFRAFIAEEISIFLGLYLDLDISFIHRKSNSVRIYLKEYFSTGKEIPPGIRKHFGTLDYTFKEIKSRPDFWISLVERYRMHRYQRVNLNMEVFEAFLSEEVPDVTSFFEASAGKPIKEISLCELIVICRKLSSVTQLVSDVERVLVEGKMTVKIRHPYSSEKAVIKLIELFSKVFRAAGYLFGVKTVSNLIILEFEEKC